MNALNQHREDLASLENSTFSSQLLVQFDNDKSEIGNIILQTFIDLVEFNSKIEKVAEKSVKKEVDRNIDKKKSLEAKEKRVRLILKDFEKVMTEFGRVSDVFFVPNQKANHFRNTNYDSFRQSMFSINRPSQMIDSNKGYAGLMIGFTVVIMAVLFFLLLSKRNHFY